VFLELYRDPVQSEEVAALGDDLPSKLDRRVLLAPSAKENAQQLGTGKRLRTLRQKPLPRPELGRKLFDCVSASFHDGILYSLQVSGYGYQHAAAFSLRLSAFELVSISERLGDKSRRLWWNLRARREFVSEAASGSHSDVDNG
jgi:hypothetical protein